MGGNKWVSGVVTYFGNETVTTDLYFCVSGLLVELLVQSAAGTTGVLSEVEDGGVVGTQLVATAPLIEVIRLPGAGVVPGRTIVSLIGV